MELLRISSSFHLLSTTFLLFYVLLPCPIFAIKKYDHVVYFGAHSHDPASATVDYAKVTDSHYEFLGSFLGSKEKAKDAIIYSYTRSIHGFSAVLEEEVANQISKHPDVISVFLNKRNKLHTTTSWTDMGLQRDGRIPRNSLMRKARFGEDVIIANLDTGVWPESESFNDRGMGPVPSRWRGICQTNTTNPIKCNRKLIGGRFFLEGYKHFKGSKYNPNLLTVRDLNGHGTHTLSTAAGRIVPADIYGQAKGFAKGGSPNARVASYKVCFGSDDLSDFPFCFDNDILGGFDAAISDGVDILSVSIGYSATEYILPHHYFKQSVSIGAFHAIRAGITVVCSAGNDVVRSTVNNSPPWIFTVAASTISRVFVTSGVLGDGMKFIGQSFSTKRLPERKLYPLINAEIAAYQGDYFPPYLDEYCLYGVLDPNKVKGKIVFCRLRGYSDTKTVEMGNEVLKAGGIGMIVGNHRDQGDEVFPDPQVLPAIRISATNADYVDDYSKYAELPMAYISYPTTRLNTVRAPVMPDFSAQGPNPIIPEIIKPDITAPGVDILAAVSGAVSSIPYNLLSGTSMACPHVTGVVGLLKSIHPDWSPSAIRSAMMTTARVRDNVGKPIIDAHFRKATPFNYGSGHVRPNRAADPGLVYDFSFKDYLNFLCSINYTSTQIAKFYDKPFSCPKNSSPLDLNYPSIGVPALAAPINITRRVKNVGGPSTYKVRIDVPQGVSISIKPSSLSFKKTGEEKAFKVELAPNNGSLGTDYVFGRITWTDGKHYVRSPIAVSVHYSKIV